MSGRGGRDRFHRDYPPRSEDKNHPARSNPPSRHLWVGNLSHNLDESTLARHFLRFGDLESVAYQPGRSYAFINFRDETDAFAAVRELQGFSIAGLPLKIEFAKADKSTPRRGEEDYMPDRDEQLPIVRSSPFSQRETRARHTSDAPYADKSKMNDKNAEPSEVLWVGFPAQLKVDEFILRKAFLPFGEIDRITAFPGRTYAFVRFKRISAACRAKETLQGKLFDNPRVHICFAKSESGSSSRERDSLNAPLSPDFIPHGRQGISEDFHHDREFGMRSGELRRSSPDYVSNLEPDYPDLRSFGRKNDAWSGEKGAFDKRRFPELGSETEKAANSYLPRKRQQIDRGGHFRDYSPEEFPRQGPFYDDPFDLPEDPLLFSETKRRTASSFPHENELPEYPFSDSGQINRMPSRPYSDFRPNPYERNTDSEAFGYNYKHIPDRHMQLNQPYVERNDLKNVPFDGHNVGPDPLVAYPERKLTPESYRPFKAEEWKWEGTIAKGGTPICRARCFPVGAVMDLILPEFLDCTAKTSLDALTKHYYQAAASWVVFFVAASDPDMALYNEFMNYLGDKQRAAVAKLDDRTTLFLVPPSEFSEKILKVPGKLSISGVVLRLEQQPSSSYVPVHLQQEQNKPNFVPSNLDNKPLKSASVPYLPASLPTFERPGSTNTSVSGNFSAGLPPPPPPLARPGNFPDLASDSRHEYAPHQQNPSGPGWSAHNVQNASANNRNISMQAANKVMTQGYNPLPASSRSSNSADNPQLSSSVTAAFQPEQLMQLASTLLEQQRQSGGVTTEWQHQRYSLPSNQLSSDLSSQYVPVHQQQQQQQIPNMLDSTQRESQPNTYVNQQQQPQFAGNEEGDTEKRLQATLQLAAALIQQIQQGKGT